MWFNLSSKEFETLSKKLVALENKLETLELTLAIYKKKLRVKAGIDEKEEAKDIYNGVLLGENGNNI